MIDQIETRKAQRNIKKFFFPFSPIKSFRSVRLLFLLAILLALRLVFAVLTIKVAPFGLSISFAWLPLMVIGWYYGPVVGLFFGMITDSLSFLISGGVWFWLYAIQEPITGLLSGLMSGWYRYRKTKNNIIFDIVLNQIIIIGFAIVSYIALIVWLNPSYEFQKYDPEYKKFYLIYKWIAVCGISLLVCVYETLTIWKLTQKDDKHDNHIMIDWIYTSSLVTLLMFLFSIALGPITTVEYWKFIGIAIPEGYSKMGALYLLIPRICIESIKVPVESLALFGIICLCDSKLESIVNKINNSWKPI